MENYETHHCNDNFTFSLIILTSQMNDKVFVTSQTSTYFMFSFHQSFTDESDAFSSKIATTQLQSFDLMQTFD